MKRLTLVRHAKSGWKDTELADFDRPLNERGERDAPEMGRRLAARQMQPDCLISSPAKRAITTASIIADAIGYSADAIITNQQIYEASVGDLVNVLQQIDDACSDVLVFGHNPGFTELSYYLTNHHIENIPTCGIVCMDLPVTSWQEVTQGSGRLVFFDYPRKDE